MVKSDYLGMRLSTRACRGNIIFVFYIRISSSLSLSVCVCMYVRVFFLFFFDFSLDFVYSKKHEFPYELMQKFGYKVLAEKT